MKTIKSKHVRKSLLREGGVEIVEHSIQKAEDEVEEGQGRPYPTLPKSANPDDPPAHASEK